MNELFAEGDLVEAVKTEIASSTRLRGVLKSTGWENGFILQAQGFSPEISELEAKGFTLTLLEKATPPLPTEQGWYTDQEGDIWRVDSFAKFWCIGSVADDENPSDYAPFTRLEPVAETAKADVLNGWVSWFEVNESHVGGKHTFTAYEVAELLRGPEPFGFMATNNETGADDE